MSERFEATGRAADGREIDKSGARRPGGDAESPQVAAPTPNDHGRGFQLPLGADQFAGLAGDEFAGWLRRMVRLGGCAAPVLLVGHTVTRDRGTGEVLHVFTSVSQPYGVLAVGCRNRRESVCPSCAFLHHGDTYQIVVSGLAGGKGVPESVADHPRLFVTLTAPSFGAVHRVTDPQDPHERCRARRGGGRCVHGAAMACFQRHEPDDAMVGMPLCADCYDYAGAVLWNASVGALWDRFVRHTRRELARRAGVRVRDLASHARVSFAKVAEFQRRGSVHLHAVVRIDGPSGPGDAVPEWASAALLGEAVTTAAARAQVRLAGVSGWGSRVLRFGGQLDVREIASGVEAGDTGLDDRAVASYVAKYITKGDLPGLVLARRLRSAGQIDATPGLSGHARTLMRMAWALGGAGEYEQLRLRLWAHQLGFRGWIATKSRAYSTTYTALRAARSGYGREHFEPSSTETQSSWRLAGVGHSPGQAQIAAAVLDATRQARAARNNRARAQRRGPAVGGWGNAAAGRAPDADHERRSPSLGVGETP